MPVEDTNIDKMNEIEEEEEKSDSREDTDEQEIFPSYVQGCHLMIIKRQYKFKLIQVIQ